MTNDISEVVPYLSTSAAIVYIQRWMKTFKFYQNIVKEIPIADKWIHRAVAAIGAFITAIGIHLTFQGDYNTGWQFHGTIPNIWDLLHGIGDFFKVFILQQAMYDATKDKAAATASEVKP